MAVRLQQLRGFGTLIATALIAAVGNGQQFTKGRQMAASIGLTPKQFSSGGKDRLSVWVTDLAKRSHPNIAAVALANKTVRMAWAMMKYDTDYDENRAAA